MAVIESPSKSAVQMEVDPSFFAARQSLRPLETNSLQGVQGGHYRVGLKTGATTVISAAGSIFSMRWAPQAPLLCVVQRILVGFNITTAFTTAQVVDLDLAPVRGYTTADSGGTSVVIASSNKKRASYPNSQVSSMNIATTAALTNGTGTADANAMAIAACGPMNANNAVGAYSGLVPLLDALGGQESPLILGASEGFRIRLATTMGAVGVGNFTVVVDWAEVPSY